MSSEEKIPATSSGEKDWFEYYFRQILAGKITRRDVVKRTGAAGAVAAGGLALAAIRSRSGARPGC